MFLILAVVVVVVLAAAVAALGSRLPVVRVCLGEDHLGCFQLALLGQSSPLACSRPVWPAPRISRRFYSRIKLHCLIWACYDIIRCQRTTLVERGWWTTSPSTWRNIELQTDFHIELQTENVCNNLIHLPSLTKLDLSSSSVRSLPSRQLCSDILKHTKREWNCK